MSMKKILLAIGMLAVLCTALCACGGEGAAKEPTLEDMLTKEMEGEVLSTVWNRYGFLQTGITTTTVKKVDEYEYQMWGKVTVTDEYGDRYSGKFNGTVFYYPSLDEISVSSCEVETLRKK